VLLGGTRRVFLPGLTREREKKKKRQRNVTVWSLAWNAEEERKSSERGGEALFSRGSQYGKKKSKAA
jgi:hypothetical protein